MADASNGFATLDKLLGLANEEFKVGTSAAKEYQNIMEALIGQVDILRESFNSLVTRAGLGAIDPLVSATQKLANALESDAALDFAEGAAKALADMVSYAGDFVEEMTASKDAFFDFLDGVQTVGKVVVAYFAGKVLGAIGKRLALLVISFAKLGSFIVKAFTGKPATGLLAQLASLRSSTEGAARSSDRMKVSFATTNASVQKDITVMVGLIRQLVAQLDALIIKLGAAQILANRLAAGTTAAIGANTALAASAAVGAAGAGAATAKKVKDTTSALKGATKASTGFLASLKGVGRFLIGGLGRILTGIVGFLLGPWSAAIFTVIALWPLFGDAITDALKDGYNAIRRFFGFQEIAFEKSTRVTERWSRKQREEAEKALAAYESAAAKFDKVVVDPFSTVGDIVEDVSLRGDAEASARAYQDLFNKVKAIGEQFVVNEKAAEASAAKTQQNVSELDSVGSRIQEIIDKRKQFEDFLKFGFKIQGFDGNAEEAIEEISELDEKLGLLQDRYKVLGKVVANAEKEQAAVAKELQQATLAANQPQFLQNVAATFDQQTLAYARSLLLVKEQTKEIDTLTKSWDKLEKASESAANLDELDNIRAQQENITLKQQELVAAKKQELVLQKEFEKANKGRGKQEEAIQFLQKQGEKNLRSTIALLNNVDAGGFLKAANGAAEAFRDARTSVEALTQFRLLQKLKEDTEQAAKAMEYYAKVAKSALDNTFVEVSAIERKFQEFQKSLVFSQIDIDIAFKYDRGKIDEIEDEFGKRRDRIKEKYDTILDAALPSQKRYWEARQEAELKSLDNEEKVSVAQIKRKRIQEQFTRYAQQTAEFFEQASRATNVNEFLALKAQGKEGLAAIQNIIREAQELETVNVFGKAAQEFGPGQIANFNRQLRGLTTESQNLVQTGNKNIVEVTKEAEEAYTKVASRVADAANKNKQIVDDLKAIFPDIARVLDAMDEVTLPADLERATKALNQAIAGLNTASAQGLGGSIDIPDIGNQIQSIREGTSDALKGAAEDGLSRVEFGKVTPKLEAATSQATQAGVSAGVAEGAKGANQEIAKGAEGAKVKVEPDEKHFGQAFNEQNTRNTYKVKLIGELESITGVGGTTIQNNARGGPISGKGTGTSDSILSWLSNGEFVMDAFTTRFFGSSFFSDLQLFARSGRMPRIPGFASGGPVGTAAIQAVTRDVVDVNLNVGGSTYSLFGERENVRQLATAMKRLERGA